MPFKSLLMITEDPSLVHNLRTTIPPSLESITSIKLAIIRFFTKTTLIILKCRIQPTSSGMYNFAQAIIPFILRNSSMRPIQPLLVPKYFLDCLSCTIHPLINVA